jgi:hypothetical protein
MENLQKYLFVLFLAIILAVIHSNANAINNCKIDGNECNFDDECCGRSCISKEGNNQIKFCALSPDEIGCLGRGVECTWGNVTCCNFCKPNLAPNWAAFCT